MSLLELWVFLKNINECLFLLLERSLDPTEKIADILYKWDKFNKSDGSQTVKFYFKRKLFLGDGNIKPSPFEELLLRSQVMVILFFVNVDVYR